MKVIYHYGNNIKEYSVIIHWVALRRSAYIECILICQ